jgi:tetratricopeptide (TPR) repeat protein
MAGFQRLRALADLRRWPELEREARRRIAADEDAGSALSWLSRALREQGRHEEALHAAEVALGRGGTAVAPHVQRGYALMALGRYEDASASARSALAIDPSNVDGLQLVVDAALVTDPAAARTAVGELRRLHPDNPWTEIYAARVASHDGRWREVERAARRALRLDPTNGWSHALIGEALCMTGRPVKGIPSLREAVRLDPTKAHWRRLLTEALVSVPASDGGSTLASELIASLDPRWRAPTLVTAAWNLMDAGRLTEAARFLDDAEAALRLLEPTNASWAYLTQIRASLEGRRGKVDRSVRMLFDGEQCARERLRGADLESYLETLAVAALRAGKPATALEYLDEVMQSARAHGRISRVAHNLGLVAEVHLDLGELGAARAAASEGLVDRLGNGFTFAELGQDALH